MNTIELIKDNKEFCKQEFKVDNTIIKVIGIGPKALKVLVQEPSRFVTKPIWNQTWFKYNELTDDGKRLIDEMVKAIPQSTL